MHSSYHAGVWGTRGAGPAGGVRHHNVQWSVYGGLETTRSSPDAAASRRADRAQPCLLHLRRLLPVSRARQPAAPLLHAGGNSGGHRARDLAGCLSGSRRLESRGGPPWRGIPVPGLSGGDRPVRHLRGPSPGLPALPGRGDVGPRPCRRADGLGQQVPVHPRQSGIRRVAGLRGADCRAAGIRGHCPDLSHESAVDRRVSGRRDRPATARRADPRSARSVPASLTVARVPEPSLRPLALADRPRFEAALAAHAVPGDPLAACSFPFHFIWQGLLRYEWMELEGHRCLFAGNQDGSFLALPPIGSDPCGPAMAKAFEFLSKLNRTPALTRIENAPENLAVRCREKGYRVAPKGPDYVYRRAELVALRGVRYKSQRVAYNHCVAHAHPLYRPFRPDDAGACLALFQQWRQGVKHDGASDLAAHLAADAEHAHRNGITHAADLGLIGRVVEVEGRIAAYTFGYPLNTSTFCVLFEIADRNVKGLGAYIFREFCRELESYELINTMDDSGLEGLRRTKLAYHPIRLIESYIVSPA